MRLIDLAHIREEFQPIIGSSSNIYIAFLVVMISIWNKMAMNMLIKVLILRKLYISTDKFGKYRYAYIPLFVCPDTSITTNLGNENPTLYFIDY